MSTRILRSLTRAGLVTSVLCGSLATGVMPAAAVQASSGGGPAPVVGLAAERVLLADKVAAAKFGTSTPVEDPVREQQVLDQAAALAAEAGIDVSDTVEFVGQLAATEDLRSSTTRCAISLVLAESAIDHRYGLDRLHERALWGAVTPLCA
ncbi:chorismate mutase [Actinophytocola oryzae]|uniref:Chorismate mutase type II n=1 Tax=Actinophytocola oryzae TaxID=502181 RepID=A0A4R7VAP1_9PSEU|nr:chorismate mutase [Actinophytocola oryzae]TDV46053.1 chorismate mutase type II [Actinophytocola oryzae]